MDNLKNTEKNDFPVADSKSSTSLKGTTQATDASDKLPESNVKSEIKSADEKKESSHLKKWKKRMRFQPKNVTLDPEKHEYYKDLLPDPKDDTFELPRAVPVAEYVEEAKKEVKAMLAAVKQHSGSKTALQTLPKHMRRRAASHNVKRLPIRLRELASQQMIPPSESSKTGEKVCRRKRRKKLALQNEYAKRAGNQGWLETHLWHSKRFHMTENSDKHYQHWSHRVSIYPNDKSFRACYRAVAKHCLIQDISYFHCVELTGSQINVKNMFKNMIQQHEHSSVFDDGVLSGKIEAEVMMCDLTCDKVICPVRILWQPKLEDNQDTISKHVVWCWIHPAPYKEATKVLEQLSTTHGVSTSDRTGDFNRFRFTGPKSSVTLMSTLQLIKVGEDLTSQNSAEHLSAKLSSWINENKDEVKKQQLDFSLTMLECHRCNFHKTHKQLTTRVCHGAVMSVLVNDPRLTLPLQKTKPTLKSTLSQEPSLLDASEVDDHEKSLEELPLSPKWKSEILEEVALSRLPDHVTSTRKNEAKFTLGEEKTKKLDSLATPVPVLLIRRSGIASHLKKPGFEGVAGGTEVTEGRSVHAGPPEDFGSGWDLILPKKWGTAFWIPFVYHRARAGGIRESEHSHLECKTPFFPRDFPDTGAGRKWWEAEMETNLKRHYSKPPAKRVNFSVMATPFPFSPDWDHIFLPLDGERESSLNVGSSPPLKQPVESKSELVLTENQNFATSFSTVTRKRSATSSDHDVIPSKKSKDSDITAMAVLRNKEKVATLRRLLSAGDFASAISLLESLTPPTLVCVQISPINRGTPSARAMLCAPSSDDFVELRREFEDLNGEGLKSCTGPVEPKHWDPYRKERKLATEQAKKRRKQKKKDEHAPLQSTNQKPHKFNVLPIRPIIGFVTSGDFLFSYASGGGVGFIAVDHLVSLLREQVTNNWLMQEFAKSAKPPIALMRLIDSTQYRFVSLHPTS
uniref:Ribonucleases P/MRP protein subunit POP1 n=1 Tax=Phallusia mammillata TaxID=59560 RepID=A0A6F9DPY3_9ASCI|nr:ribonucleases P/MRP protein subunit POP1 [Phallusia mammillata]